MMARPASVVAAKPALRRASMSVVLPAPGPPVSTKNRSDWFGMACSCCFGMSVGLQPARAHAGSPALQAQSGRGGGSADEEKWRLLLPGASEPRLDLRRPKA